MRVGELVAQLSSMDPTLPVFILNEGDNPISGDYVHAKDAFEVRNSNTIINTCYIVAGG